MDIVFRLRFVLWILVLGLWGSLIFEFIQDESTYNPPQLTTIRNPFRAELEREALHRVPAEPFPQERRPPEDVKASPGPLPVAARGPVRAASGSTSAPFGAPVPFAGPLPSPRPLPPRPEMDRAEPQGSPSALPTSVALAHLPKRPAAPPPTPPLKEFSRPEPTKPEAPLRRSRAVKAPEGFSAAQSAHFTVFQEGAEPSTDFLLMLEQLHSNLMLDLAAFAPWARDERVTIYLFETQSSYQRLTGRPTWSGGASSVAKRTVYAYKSSELVGILAHELCHIFFDGFFAGGTPDPLWLSEGMATLVQVERGLAAPNWIRPNMDMLAEGEGYGLQEMTRVQNLAGATDRSVRLWYTQSYSVVRFLIRSKWFVSYYHFCKLLREGQPVAKALFTAYGMPYNRLSALEHAWRYDVRTSGIRRTALDTNTAALE